MCDWFTYLLGLVYIHYVQNNGHLNSASPLHVNNLIYFEVVTSAIVHFTNEKVLQKVLLHEMYFFYKT